MSSHDWRPGQVQHCGNRGCAWKRTRIPDNTTSNPIGALYVHGKRGVWRALDAEPECGSGPVRGKRPPPNFATFSARRDNAAPRADCKPPKPEVLPEVSPEAEARREASNAYLRALLEVWDD